jgi:crotonobetainyl-CoA:carnitine CoA-transferase CaiB-like acyl-CoA transferase
VKLPLDGVRIIDMTSVVMGPLGTHILADQGADVIVIEDRRGDTNRSMGVGPHPELSGVTMNLMRNKRSIGLDVRTPQGYEALGRLVAGADVFVTNLRPGSRTRARITYDDIRAFKSDIVYCAAAGFPVGSELADAPAYDDIIQSASGVPELSQRVGQPPVLMPTLVADKSAGLVIANAIAVALFQRERTGEGCETTIAMNEVMRSYLLVEHGASAIPEPPFGPAGYARILTPERRPHATADGMVHVLPYDQTHYETIFRLGGRHDLIGDERISTRRSRIENGGELYREVATILLQRTTDEWMEVFRAADIPSTRVGTVDDLMVDLPIADHPYGGRYRVTPPLTGSAATLDVVRRPAPLHGEHNREVLAELGYSDAEIDGFERDDVLYAGPT